MTAIKSLAPAFLMEKKIWILWKLEERNGKTTKVPYQVNGRKASTTNEKTWTSFEEAAKAYDLDQRTKKRFNGLGVCFDGTFTGTDLDHCVNDGEINETARDVIETLGSYHEFSPSKTGVHILVEGTIDLLRNRRKGTGIEIYNKARFFTFTCDRLPGSSTEMVKNVEGLQAVFDKYLADGDNHSNDTKDSTTTECQTSTDDAVDSTIDRMKHSSSWPEIEALMVKGDTSKYDGDDSAADLALCNHLAFFTRRNRPLMDAIFRTCRLYRPKWDEMHGNQTYGDRTIDRACRDTKTVYGDPTRGRYTEGGNAERFIDLHGDDLRFCGHMNTWFKWDGNRWSPDMTGAVYQMSRDVVVQLYAEATQKLARHQRGEITAKEATSVSKFAKTTDTARGLQNIIKLASTMPEVAVSPEQLDCQSWKLNTVGTTLNFDTPEELVHEPAREDMITKMCGCSFNFDAACPQWERFMDEIFASDKELIRFVQKAVGYSLIGKINEKCFFFCYGDGSNGKTVFLNVLRAMFGDYGQQASIRTFLKRRGDSEIRDDLVNLKGARFVTAVEPDENSKFDMEVMKPLTGNDPIRCRTLHQRQIEYLPEAKLWIAGNNKPLITETNTGAWDRVRLIPFTVSFVGREDRGLEDKLRAELSGILNWAIRGYRMYLEEGLDTPKCVREATEQYKVECNSLLSFIETHCVTKKGLGLEVRTTLLHERYKGYCELEGYYSFSTRRIKATLKEQGIQMVHKASGDFYNGITLKELAPGQTKFEKRPRSIEDAPDDPGLDLLGDLGANKD